MLGLLLALWTSPADAQPRGDASVHAGVQAGEDLAAWREVDCQDAEALRAFIQAYPTSPLAELALGRLEELDQAPPVLSPVERVRLENSREQHQDALTRESTAVYVAPTELTSRTAAPLMHPTLELGWTSGMHVYVAGGVRRGWAGLTLRTVASADAPLSLDMSLRISPWNRGMSPYAELIGQLRDPGLGLALGVAQPLRREFSMNIALETPVLGQRPSPTLRVGMLKSF